MAHEKVQSIPGQSSTTVSTFSIIGVHYRVQALTLSLVVMSMSWGASPAAAELSIVQYYLFPHDLCKHDAQTCTKRKNSHTKTAPTI